MKKKAIILIIISGILWGTSAIFANLLKPFGFSALQMTAMRAIVASFILIIFTVIYDVSLLKVKIKHIVLFALNGSITFLTAFLYYESMSVSCASVAVMLMYTAPVFVTAVSVIFMGEKINLIKFISIFMILLGCCLISGILGDTKFNKLGVITGLLSGLSYSAYNILVKYEMDKDFNPISASVYGFFFMAVITLFVSDVPGIIYIANTNPVNIYPLVIGIGIFTIALPYFLYTVSLKYVPVGTASALGVIEPMTASVFGILFFGDPMSVYSIIGIILVIASVLILSFNKE